jgi:hypothetical protein
MDKDEILAEMQRTAKENGGKPLGKSRFENVTGINEYVWLKYWSRFSDLQREAGFKPNRLQSAYNDDYLCEKIVGLMRELKKFPTTNEIRTKALNDSEFPHLATFQRHGSKQQLISKTLSYCLEKTKHEDIVKILEPLIDMEKREETGNLEASKQEVTYGYVYLVKGHPGEYKIGHTTLVDRRLPELGVKASIKPNLIHEIKTDDPKGIEVYWHKRFENKRMRGEWFRLTAVDVRAFKRWRKIY